MKLHVGFSGKEISHIVISVVLMSALVAVHMGFGLIYEAFSLDALAGLLAFGFYFGLAFIIIVPAFVLHELGHKFLAQKFGYWAEYRMWTQGLLLAVLITIISRGQFLFVAPGAVYFAQQGFAAGTKEKVGRIGLIGPVINLFLGVGFGLLSFFVPSGLWSGVFKVGASVNAFLAIFNLIPFPPLDGEKVFVWDKKIWIAAIAMAVVLYAVLAVKF